MAISRGFPSSNTISAGVRIVEKDESFIPAEQSFHRAAIVGFASKGPVNIPTLCRNRNDLHRQFGFPHPEESDPYGIYGGELYTDVANELFYVRVADTDLVSDERAETADVDIPAAGSQVVIQSDTAGPYSFSDSKLFRFRVNGVLSAKTLVVLPDSSKVTFSDPDVTTKAADSSYTCTQLAAALNDQLTADDPIEFVCNSDKIAVQTKLAYGPSASIEFVSVQDSLVGPSSIIDLGTGMTPASITGTKAKYPNDAYGTDGQWDFSGVTNLQLLVVVDGTDNIDIDNALQVVDLAAIEGVTSTTAEVVTAINDAIEDLPGGFEAVATGNNIKISTLHAGRDARLLIKSESTGASIFGFDGTTAIGTSPQGSSGDAAVDTYGIVNGDANEDGTDTFSITADSPGIEGNLTQVRITNDDTEGTFQMEVINNGVVMESWGPLTKDQNSFFYVETFINTKSDYIRVTDDTSTLASPADGTYSLTGGTDGIPSDPDKVDELIIGNEVGFTGLYALSEPEQFDIDLVAAPGHSSSSVISALIDLCENKRQDCMAIIDPPINLTPREIVQWHNGIHPLNGVKLDSDFAALYWPWLKMRDTHNRVDVWIPPSGAVMAAIARSDQLFAPWFAPAGQDRGQLPAITGAFQKPGMLDRDLLYGNGSAINPITHHTDTDAYEIGGNKTLQRYPSSLNRINVRRMMFVIEKRIRQRSRRLLFDPHDEEFRSRFVQIASQVLDEVRTGRGITDYIILADDSINTADVIDRNEFIAKIGIVPRKAVEFIFLEFSLHRTGSFTEPENLL